MERAEEAAPEVPVPQLEPPAPTEVDEINPFQGPLPLGIDSPEEDTEPPVDVVAPENPGPIPASGVLGEASMGSPGMPICEDSDFHISNYTMSEDGEEDTGQLTTLGLYPTIVGRPGSSLGLGTEVARDTPVEYQYFLINPEICLIMPSDLAEIVTIGQRQFYRIPVTHSATGAPAYLCSPVEMAPPPCDFTVLSPI